MNKLKQEIENKFRNLDIASSLHLIEEYEKKYKDDLELLSFKTAYYMHTNNLEEAKKYALQAVKRNHYNVEACYNLATVYDLLGDYNLAYEYYTKTMALQQNSLEEVVNISEIEEQANSMVDKIKGKLLKIEDKELQEIELQNLKELFNKVKINSNILENDYKTNPIIGTIFEDCFTKKYYIGRCDDWYHSYFYPMEGLNTLESKCEIYEIYKTGKEFEFNFNENQEMLLPIVSNIEPQNTQNKLTFFIKNNEYNLVEIEKCTFNYYKISGKVKIKAVNDVLIGKPIEIMKNPKKKSLVLNIFVDSLTQQLFNEEELNKLMPNTYDFFSKGVICKNVYSGSEFTYPSIATYTSGLYPNNHMMLNSNFHIPLPTNVTLLSEYFKENGFVTAKIGGNDSNTPNYGYIRGIDRFVHQQQTQGLNVHQVVQDVLDHIETFKDTNQFICMDIADLHDVAGGFRRPISVQSKIPIEYRVCDNSGGSTVKQTFSSNKKVIFKEELKRVDKYLSSLYSYIENNYTDDEIIITFFSDHGTAFMVKNEDHFMSASRSNVPLMIRSDYKSKTHCTEMIATADYSSIMCKLAGISMKEENTDGMLPKFFGGTKEREYTISQSIFPGDPYRASLHGKKFAFYFTSKDKVKDDCRVNLDDFITKLVDESKNVIVNKELEKKCIAIVLGHMSKLRIY